ncbi:MAG TPA: tyrosine-type recombinase/integrase [Longimicrobiales bacterium]
MGRLMIPYLVTKPSGYYWQPNKALRALGFRPQPLGKDPVKAAREAEAWNRRVKAEKERRARASAPEADRPGEGWPPIIGSYADLVDVYRGNAERGIPPSREWRNLSAGSQRTYNKYIRKILRMWRDDAVADTTVEVVIEARDALLHKPHTANGFVATLSAMLDVACTRPSRFGLADNPCRNVGRFGEKDGVKPRHQYWADEDEQAFIEKAEREDWEMRVAYDLLVYTGQRPIDVRGMTVKDYDGEKIRVVQQKTGARVWIPVHRDLKHTLDRHFEKRKAAGRIGGHLIQTERGKGFNESNFRERWNAIARPLGLAHLQRRDLRRTAVIRLAEAGCTIPEIAAITGHSIQGVESILRTYLVRTYPQAQAAIRKLEDYRSRAPVVVPDDAASRKMAGAGV